MPELNEIEACLTKEPFRLAARIVREIGNFTVALFGVFESTGGDQLRLAGTGTLVEAAGSYWILTAAHVWEEILQKSSRVGISLKENVDHRFLLDTKAITPVGPQWSGLGGEWGPDITLLRIPREYAGTISAYQSFYNLERERRMSLDVKSLEIHVLMGTPAESGQYTETQASVEITGHFNGGEVRHHVRDGFDYFDLDVDLSLPGVPQNFGGVSGGGLWKVRIYCPPSSDEIATLHVLDGVAFYQTGVVGGHRTIRCHGNETIRLAVANLRS